VTGDRAADDQADDDRRRALMGYGMVALAALLSGGIAGGVVLVIAGIRGTTEPKGPVRSSNDADRLALRLALAIILGVGTYLFTRWPVFGAAAALLGWASLGLLGGNAAAKSAIAKVEAVATWVENLRDTMAGGARGLSQAIIATAPMAPPAIAREVQELADRIAAREPIDHSLRVFAAQLGDPSADQVVIALLLVADPRQRFGGVSNALSELAVSTRDRVKMRLRVDVGQSRMRNSARFMLIWSVGFVFVLRLLSADFLEPYSTFLGQLVLAVIGLLFAAAMLWLNRMARHQVLDRFISHHPGAPR
jgi:tight adherence protein B